MLYRIPLRWGTSRGEEEASGPERRKGDGRPAEPTAWIGFRFEGDAAARDLGRPWLATATEALRDESWWKGFFALAAALIASQLKPSQLKPQCGTTACTARSSTG